MKKVILFFIFLSCNTEKENKITPYFNLVFRMSEMRGQAQILSQFKKVIPSNEYEMKANSIGSTMDSIARVSASLELNTKDKKFIDEEIQKITYLLQR
jgi:hypothetical protein